MIVSWTLRVVEVELRVMLVAFNDTVGPVGFEEVERVIVPWKFTWLETMMVAMFWAPEPAWTPGKTL